MNMSIEDKIRNFVQNHLYFSEVLHDDDSFLDEGIIDSTGTFELAAFVEAEFRIKVEPSDIIVKNFGSVRQLASYVRRKVPAVVNRQLSESSADLSPS